MYRYLLLAGFLVLVFGAGHLVGTRFGPNEWYDGLAKPMTPPDWAFGPSWSFVYVLIAVAGWRTWLRQPWGNAMKLWWAQLVLVLGWSPAFYTLQMIGLALGIVALLLFCIYMFIALTWNRDRVAAWLFMPYFAWVALALLINGAFLWLN